MIVVLAINLLIDTYIYVAARKRCRSKVPAKIQLVSSLCIYAGLIVTLGIPRRTGTDAELLTVMWLLFGYFTLFVPKLVFVIVDAIASIPMIFRHRRVRWISLSGGILAVITFLALWWGALVNRYCMQVNEITVEIPYLPEAFDGYRIVQFSDLHSGTYGDDTTYVSHIVDRINAVNADMIVFTGDIVNRRTSELPPFVSALSRLEAPDGVFSILGNHDYGDYADWNSVAEKQQSMRQMIDLQREMGWRLLLNEHEVIRHEGDSIILIGVENVGDPPFHCYGSLEDSYPSLSDSNTKILLTHNPAHWTDGIAGQDSVNIALTLSGHTHAMQIEILGWSPAKYRYPTWGGIYRDDKGEHPLYVNIGLGTVGIPMRLGATPEITVLTLRAKPDRLPSVAL